MGSTPTAGSKFYMRDLKEVEAEYRSDPSVFDVGLGRRFFGMEVLNLSLEGAYRDVVCPYEAEKGYAQVRGELRSTMKGSPVKPRPCIMTLRWDVATGLNERKIELVG